MKLKQLQNNEVEDRRLTALGKTDTSRQFPNLNENGSNNARQSLGPS